MARQKQQELRDVSDELLEEMRALKALEQEKRGQEISTPRFHQLAGVIEAKSRDIFALARDERVIGEGFDSRQGISTEEVDPHDSAAS